MMKILVTNPAGPVGREVLEELLAPEFDVRVLATDPSHVTAVVRSQVEFWQGDACEPQLLTQALQGIDALFWSVPCPSDEGGDGVGYYGRFAAAAATAIRAAGTPRVVNVSAGGKGRAQAGGALSGLHDMEDILNRTGAAIRHLRCGLLMEELLAQAGNIRERGMISFPMPGHIPLPVVAGRDVADAALRWLVRSDWRGVSKVPVHGPADLSLDEMAALLEAELGCSVQYREASANLYVRILMGNGAGREYARSRVQLFAELASGVLSAELRTGASGSGTTFAEWARSTLLPLLHSSQGEGSAARDWCGCSC